MAGVRCVATFPPISLFLLMVPRVRDACINGNCAYVRLHRPAVSCAGNHRRMTVICLSLRLQDAFKPLQPFIVNIVSRVQISYSYIV